MISWLYVSSQQLQNFIDTFLDYWEKFFSRLAPQNFSGAPYLLDIVLDVALLAIAVVIAGKIFDVIKTTLKALAAA